MRFDLEIFEYEDKASLGDKLIGTHSDVDVEWQSYYRSSDGIRNDDYNSTAIATKSGVVARMITFDDYPIQIFQSDIKIEGIHPSEEFGYWRLTPIKP